MTGIRSDNRRPGEADDMPETPFYVMDGVHGRCLELGGDGSYQACLDFLSELQKVFGARSTKHVEGGQHPHADKERGYWNVQMFGQDSLAMRERGCGMCLWGPKPPAEIDDFLRICRHFGAVERTPLLKRIASELMGRLKMC